MIMWFVLMFVIFLPFVFFTLFFQFLFCFFAHIIFECLPISVMEKVELISKEFERYILILSEGFWFWFCFDDICIFSVLIFLKLTLLDIDKCYSRITYLVYDDMIWLVSTSTKSADNIVCSFFIIFILQFSIFS